MSGRDPVGEAVAALDAAFRKCIAAVDVGDGSPRVAFSFPAILPTAILKLIEAVLDTRHTVAKAVFDNSPVMGQKLDFTAAYDPADIVSDRAAPDILDKIEDELRRIVARMRKERDESGLTFTHVATMAKLVETIRSLTPHPLNSEGQYF